MDVNTSGASTAGAGADRREPTGANVVEAAVLERRLAALRDELAIGERALQELAARRDELVAVVLRISGGVRVLEELLGSEGTPWTAER